MAFFTNPLMILAILCFNIAISELLVKKTGLRLIGTALLVIIITAVVANFNIIPSASNPSVIYKGIFKYVAPIAIFFLLLQVNIRNLKKAGMPMLIMFVIGSMGTIIGVVCALWIVSGQETIGAYYHAICGMFTGTYTGGSINFNAIALHYDVAEQGNLYAGSIAVDNIISALWMVVTLILPKLLSVIFKRKFKYKISANHRTKDKTYVSKTTGLVATFGGQSIADRYDSKQINYLAELSYKPYKYLKLETSYRVRDKSYQAFEIARLSNLDYSHQELVLGMEYKASEVGKFYLNVGVRQREYVDKRTKDLDGVDIIDSNLLYDYHEVNIGYIYRPSKDTRWKYSYQYEDRTDNGSGYFDANSGYLSIAGKYRLGDYHFLKSRVKYSRFSFINQLDPGEDPLDEDAKEKQGASLMVGYEWVVATLFDSNFALYLELEYSNFDNTNLVFDYDRSMASLGIRWSAF